MGALKGKPPIWAFHSDSVVFFGTDSHITHLYIYVYAYIYIYVYAYIYIYK